MNAESADGQAIEAVAARIAETSPALALMPAGAAATAVKRRLPADARLPRLLPLPRLLAAAAALPIDANIIHAAAALETSPPSDEQLLWRLYAQLRPHCGSRYSRDARLQLAKKLARLFAEVEACAPGAGGENPFKQCADSPSHEWTVASLLWDSLAEETRQPPLLQQLAAQLPPDLLAVCDEDTSPAERAFYQQCGADILDLQPSPAEEQWREAFTLEGEMPGECIHTAQEGIGATLSETAALAQAALGLFLRDLPPQETIGVIVYDRLLARRLRAMADAAAVKIADGGGWRAETLACGAALSLYAQAALGDFSLESVAALLTPPFYAARADLPQAARQWQRLFADELRLPANSGALLKLCGAGKAASLAAIAADVHQARWQAAAAGSRAAAEWLEWLHAAAAAALAAWAKDPLAQTLSARLRQRAGADVRLDAGEFLLWLSEALAAENISSQNISSRIEFVTPDTRREFGALLLLGYAGKIAKDSDSWLGENERARLNLPLAADRVSRERRQFSRLLAAHTRIAAVWCGADTAGKPQAAAPYWRVFAEHCRGAGRLQTLEAGAEDSLAAGVSPPPPAAAVAAALPPALGISAADTLMKCPYRFYSLNLLRLADDEEEPVNDISPRLRGTLLHQALAALLGDPPAPAAGRDELAARWQSVLAERLQGDRPGAALLRLYWQLHSDELIDWEWQRRSSGWQPRAAEYKVEISLPLKHSGEVILKGRIDRLDAQGEQIAVIDYKSGGLPSKKALAAGEQPQILLYAFVAEILEQRAAAEQMLYRPLHKNSAAVAAEGAAPARRAAARLRRALRQIDAGAALPASGALMQTCPACPARGLCRRDHWHQPPP